jgi:asparagine synthase (glutamine-hydrolysing)
MCGIAGIYNLNGPTGVSLPAIERMITVLHHRGPDETGVYLDDRVGLGHARLSIIDLSSGTQPIHNEDETMWIVYNGEIFNYLELKQDLLRRGHRFYTTSDTEVILHLYEEEGADCLRQLNGQFAFAIWDVTKSDLFLARDRVGIRPLHYTVCDDTLIFASEIKSIFMNERVHRELDPIAIDQIFTFWTTLTPRTAFKDIYELPPGHHLTARGDRIVVKRYWEIPFRPRAEQSDLPVREVCEEIQELLRDAVRIRLRADVPVGCYLSGGLDSSGIAAIIARNFDSDLTTFGIRFEEDRFDEGEHQKQMVSFLGVDHSEIQATNDRIGIAFPDTLWHCEKPLLRTAPVPLFMLSKLVHENGFKVVLTGEGADEVFGGYNIFREAKVRRFWAKYPQSQRRAGLVGQLYPYIFKDPRLKRTLGPFFAKGLDKTDDPIFSHLVRWENTSRLKTFFSQELKAAIGQYCGYEQVRRSLPDAYEKWDILSKAQYLEMTIFLSNYLLSSQGDRVAMAHSVEIRVPYLDFRVIDFAGRVPAKWRILGLREKHILKRSFQGILPESITGRPKHPYRAPIKESLLNQKTAEYTEEMLSKQSLERTGLFDVNKVTGLLQKLRKLDNPSELDNMALAGILSSELIYRQFVDGFPTRLDFPICPDLVIDRRSEALKHLN